VKRTDGGHRLFDRGELDRLLFVSDLRTAGLSLDEIKEILDLKKGASTAKDAAQAVRRILGARMQELHEKLAVLTRLRDEFAQTSEIIASCLTCQDHETFPDGCRDCSVITSHAHLPRSTRVVWAVGPAHPRPSAPSVEGKPEGDKDPGSAAVPTGG
jgi:DNA-binding transcriptional MerR regulator